MTAPGAWSTMVPVTEGETTPDDAGSTAVTRRSARRASPRRRGPSVVTIIGILLIVTGLASLGWMGYQYFGTNGPSREAAAGEVSDLKDQWSKGQGADVPGPAATPAPGSAQPTAQSSGSYTRQQLDAAMAILRIPALGATYEVPVMSSISDYSLARGVGWYPTTALPGQVGNFALAGHRITHGEPFARLLELKQGDQIVVETKQYVYTYVLDQEPAKLTVKDVDTWVIDPVPGKKDVAPTQAIITLTTCQDLFHSPDRSVGFGHLVDTRKK